MPLPKALPSALLVAALGLAGCSAVPSDAPRAGGPSRPNILFILADDLGYSDVGCFGGRRIRTPVLDRLASQGTRFTDFYCAAPVCSPSRVSTLTGRFSIHTGVQDNGQTPAREETTIAEALRPLGYATGLVGKWHAAGGSWAHAMDQGFDVYFGPVFAGAAHAYWPKTFWRGRGQEPNRRYATDAFTEEAIAFLRANRARSFFLYLPYTAPHFAIEAPPEAVATYRGRFEEDDPDVPIHATYAAMVTRLDEGIGRVLGALDELGLAGRTLVVFTSDHGATFEAGNRGCSKFFDSNAPFRGGKRTLYEGGLRVPLLVRWPGQVPAGAVSAERLHATDLFPTFLALAGGTPDPSWAVDGADVSGVWRGAAKAPERTLFWIWPEPLTLAARRGAWKAVKTGSRTELYDLAEDPSESDDRSARRPEVARELEREIEAWRAASTKR